MMVGADYFGTGCQVDVTVFAQRVVVSMRPRLAEVERRRAIGAAGIESHDLLRALMTMPEGVAISHGSLAVEALLVLDELVRIGAVDELSDRVVRRAVVPVDLVGLTKLAATWADVQAVTLLRTHAPRLVIAAPRLARRVLNEIDPEVGVAVLTSDGPQCLRIPSGRRVRPTWRRWATAETAYAAWISGVQP